MHETPLNSVTILVLLVYAALHPRLIVTQLMNKFPFIVSPTFYSRHNHWTLS
jgi:hypothetical protein